MYCLNEVFVKPKYEDETELSLKCLQKFKIRSSNYMAGLMIELMDSLAQRIH